MGAKPLQNSFEIFSSTKTTLRQLHATMYAAHVERNVYDIKVVMRDEATGSQLELTLMSDDDGAKAIREGDRFTLMLQRIG